MPAKFLVIQNESFIPKYKLFVAEARWCASIQCFLSEKLLGQQIHNRLGSAYEICGALWPGKDH